MSECDSLKAQFDKIVRRHSFRIFHNMLRVLRSIDLPEFTAAGLTDPFDWEAFRENPYYWFVRASDEKAARLWLLLEKRTSLTLSEDWQYALDVLERLHCEQLDQANAAFEEGDQGSAILITHRADGVKLALDTLFPPDDGEDWDEPYGDNVLDTRLQGWEGT